jgi:hypothetical protein
MERVLIIFLPLACLSDGLELCIPSCTPRFW